MCRACRDVVERRLLSIRNARASWIPPAISGFDSFVHPNEGAAFVRAGLVGMSCGGLAHLVISKFGELAVIS